MKSKRSRELLILVGILLAGAVLRGLYLRELVGAPDFSTPVVDPGFHDYWARALVSGDWTPPKGEADPLISSTPYLRPPGYPYFLSLIYRVAGLSYLAPRIVQMVFGLINVVLAFLLGKKWFGRSPALIFAALMSSYWIFIYFEGEFQEPALLIFLLLSFVYVLALWTERLSFRYALGAGLLLGLAALVKPNPLLFLPVGVGWTFWIARRRRKPLRTYGAGLGLVLGAIIAVAPATIRNYRVADDFVFISCNSGINLFIGNNEYAGGLFLKYVPGWGHFHTCYDYPRIVKRVEEELGRPLKYSEVSAYFTDKALRFIRENPSKFAQVTIKRVLLFWGPAEISHNKVIDCERRFSRALSIIPGNFPLVLSLSILGIIRLALDHRSERRRKQAPSPWFERRMEVSVLVASFILVFFLSYLPFFNAALYRVPLIPFLLLFGAYGIYRIGQFASTGSLRRSASWLLFCVFLYLLVGSFTVYRSPGPAAWHCHRGKLYAYNNDLDRAIEEARAAVRDDPSFAEAHYLLATWLRQHGQLNEALAAAGRALRLNQDSPDWYCFIGDLLLEQDRPEAAITQYRQALFLDPHHEKAQEGLSNALAKRRQ
ncbi:MAG: glycosyltransferase family 39 protein [Phycisphaerae bacterium]|nr:glycosyltransferase family 39 protein [Phycisphaerae bacterium]